MNRGHYIALMGSRAGLPAISFVLLDLSISKLQVPIYDKVSKFMNHETLPKKKTANFLNSILFYNKTLIVFSVKNYFSHVWLLFCESFDNSDF